MLRTIEIQKLGTGHANQEKSKVQDTPSDLSCTPLVVERPWPVPYFCHKKHVLAQVSSAKARYRTDHKSGVQDRGVPPKGDYRTGP